LPARNIELVGCQRAEVEQAFEVLAAKQRYAHHAVMSQRICQSIDCFRVRHDKPQVLIKLRVFCLFFGVVDDCLDVRGPVECSLLLARFADPLPTFTPEVVRSAPLLAVEFLKAWIAPNNYSDVLTGLHELHHAVVQERTAVTIRSYMAARRASGRLTSEVAYRLIANELRQPRPDVLSYMCEVAEIGNLIDSLVDMSRDRRHGVLNFRPTLTDRARLLTHVFEGSFRLLARYPRMAGLFGNALRDVCRDSWRRNAVQVSQEH